MNAKLIFFISSTIIFILSIITICCAPIINRLFYDFENWKSQNCELYSDLGDTKNIGLKDFENFRYLKNLCRRQKAMYNLEYASLIINASLSFICFYLSLLLGLDIGKEFKNIIGIVGFISGIICFVLSLVYACFNGYILNNDIAFAKVGLNSLSLSNAVKKLFPNGATYKWNKGKYINAYEYEPGEYGNYIKYKDLGDKTYNYDNELYKKFILNDPCFRSSSLSKPSSYINSCEYIFEEPNEGDSNRYLYNRWMVTLVLDCFIFLFNLFHTIFGYILFKEKKEEFGQINSSLPNVIEINTNANNELLVLNENNNDNRINKIKENENNEDNMNKNDDNDMRKEEDKKDADVKNSKENINNIDNINEIRIKKIRNNDNRINEINRNENKEIKIDNKEIRTSENNSKEINKNENNKNLIDIDDINNNENNDLISVDNNDNNNLIKNENNNNDLISAGNNNKDLISVGNNNNEKKIDTNNNNIDNKKDNINNEDKNNGDNKNKDGDVKDVNNDVVNNNEININEINKINISNDDIDDNDVNNN